MTLRELGALISERLDSLIDAIHNAVWTVKNVGVLDWPLWLLGVVGLFAFLLLKLFFGEYQCEDGKYRVGWFIFGETMLAFAGYVALYAGCLALLFGAAMALMLLFMEDVVYPRWWGAVGLVLIIAIGLGAARAFRAYDRRKARAEED